MVNAMNQPVNKRTGMPVFDRQDVKVLGSESCHSGFLDVKRYTLRHRLYRGGWSDTLHRELMERAPGVGVLLYDPERDKVVLVEQFRAGCLENPRGPWVQELVAGIIEDGETPADVAIREAREEANQSIERLLPVCEYYNSPGGSSEKHYLFCAGVNAELAEGVFGLEEEQEDIRTVIMDRSEAEQRIAAGRINNAMSIIALQWLTLNLTRVRKELLSGS